MRKSKIIAAIFAIAIVLTSCSKEEIYPTNEVTYEPTSGVTLQPIGVTIPNTVDSKMGPTAEAELSPCGNGVNVTITEQGVPVSVDYEYIIRIAETHEIVDAGTISNGQNTTWSLAPCANYEFEFWGNLACPSCSTVQTITSDGCNGTFKC